MRSIFKLLCVVLISAMFLAIGSLAFAVTTSVTGNVEKRGENYILCTPEEIYLLKGSEMIPEMDGKEVTVTGRLEEKNKIKTIDVLSYDEAEEVDE